MRFLLLLFVLAASFSATADDYASNRRATRAMAHEMVNYQLSTLQKINVICSYNISNGTVVLGTTVGIGANKKAALQMAKGLCSLQHGTVNGLCRVKGTNPMGGSTRYGLWDEECEEAAN